MKKIIFSFVLGLGVLAGCNSLNNSFNTITVKSPDEQKTGKDRTDDDTPAVVEPDPCATFVFPTLAKTPELPYAALIAAGNDMVALERIERRHIDELRLYISKSKEAMAKSRAQYVQLCTQRIPSK